MSMYCASCTFDREYLLYVCTGDVYGEEAIAKYNEEQGKAQTEAYYTCFDIMQKYGLGKTQVRRFAETHGVRIKKAKGGRANLYLKADWEAARKNAEKTSASTKAKRT